MENKNACESRRFRSTSLASAKQLAERYCGKTFKNYFLTASLAAAAALSTAPLAASAAAFTAAEAAGAAAFTAAEAAATTGAAAEAAASTAGAGTAAGLTSSAFLPQAAKATTATTDAKTRAFFISNPMSKKNNFRKLSLQPTPWLTAQDLSDHFSRILAQPQILPHFE
jgi:hypothetical protein